MNKWIPISILPEMTDIGFCRRDSEPVLGLYTYGRIAVVKCYQYDDGPNWTTDSSESWNINGGLKAWMPLPSTECDF